MPRTRTTHPWTTEQARASISARRRTYQNRRCHAAVGVEGRHGATLRRGRAMPTFVGLVPETSPDPMPRWRDGRKHGHGGAGEAEGWEETWMKDHARPQRRVFRHTSAASNCCVSQECLRTASRVRTPSKTRSPPLPTVGIPRAPDPSTNHVREPPTRRRRAARLTTSSSCTSLRPTRHAQSSERATQKLGIPNGAQYVFHVQNKGHTSAWQFLTTFMPSTGNTQWHPSQGRRRRA